MRTEPPVADVRVAWWTAGFFALALVGCATAPPTPPPNLGECAFAANAREVVGVRADASIAEQQRAACINWVVTQRTTATEGVYYAGTLRQQGLLSLPRVGLALSGGGIRSAAFSIGVLHGLSDAGVLDNVDIISSVSGGSYASAWFFVNQAATGATTADLFAPDSRFLNDVEGKHFVPLRTAIATAVWGLAWTIARYKLEKHHPRLHLIHADLMAHQLYQMRIAHKFTQGQDLSWKEVGARIKGRLPLPIVNAAIHHQYGSRALRDSTFEFTPLGAGPMGAAEGNPPILPVLESVAISAAAVDLPTLPWYELQVKLGLAIGYRLSDDRGYLGLDADLVDAGEADNLGAYALISRLCQSIILVDASYDPHMRFDDYRRLKTHIKNELHADLIIPAIEQHLSMGSPIPPVMTGTVTGFVLRNAKGEVVPRPLTVTYVKLSLDTTRYGYPLQVRQIYDADCASRCRFPFDPTWREDYAPQRFSAYEMLGQWSTMQNASLLP